jgi:hypothetical protein
MSRVFCTTFALIGYAFLAVLPVNAGADASKQPSHTQALPSAPVAMPSAETIVSLIRRTLLTLNDALQTGNFTVLRDVAAPSFREINTAHKLSGVFAPLIAQDIDLSPVAVLAPELVDPPAIDPKTSLLRLRGRYAAKNLRLEFELFFQHVVGTWRPFGISVVPQPGK